jgi:hypothetical protein
MPRGFALRIGLPRRGGGDAAPATPATDRGPIDPDEAPVGPPVLLPASIVRQVLIDATEITPVWARPRPPAPVVIQDAAPADAEPAATAVAGPEPSTAARRRRSKADSSSSVAGPSKAGTRSRTPRTRKPNTD